MTYLAISPEEVHSLEKDLERIERKVERLITERDEYKSAYENGVKLALKKSIEFENMRKREASLAVMLGKACDEQEGIFNSTGRLASVEIATDYTVWAKFLEDNYGRSNHVVDDVMEWIEKI